MLGMYYIEGILFLVALIVLFVPGGKFGFVLMTLLAGFGLVVLSSDTSIEVISNYATALSFIGWMLVVASVSFTLPAMISKGELPWQQRLGDMPGDIDDSEFTA